jgi:hypothetical protein
MQDSDNSQDASESGASTQNSVDIEKLAPTETIAAKERINSDITIEEGKRLNLKETTRSWLGIGLLAIYGITIGFTLGITNSDKIKDEERKEILILIITSQATLVGTALGFYFGKEK